MAEQIRITIDPEQLSALGRLLGGRQTQVSPFRYGANGHINETQRRDLIRKGVLTAGGHIADNVRPTLHRLATTNVYTRVHFSDGPDVFEHLAYFAADGSGVVGITSVDEGFDVQDPAPTEEVLEGLRQYTGGSILRSCDFDAEVGVDEAIVLAAFIDLYRHAVLRAFLDKTPFSQGLYDMDAIRQAIVSTPTSTQWLTSLVRNMLEDEEPSLSEARVRAAVEGLTEAGQLVRTGDRYMLTEPGALVGSRFLVFDNILTVSSGRETDTGTLFAVGFVCIQAGVHDILLLDTSDDLFQFRTLSSEAMLAYVRHFLSDPDALTEVARAEEEQTGVPAFCTQCGTRVTPGDRFCRTCGRQLLPTRR